MNKEKDDEKLTPSSRKSYDGERIPMAEEKQFDEQPDESQEEKDKQERGSEKNDPKEQKEKRSSLAEILSSLLASASERNNAEENEIIGVVVDSFTRAAKADKNPEKAVADALSLFLVPEQPKTDRTKEEQAQSEAAQLVFQTIVKSAEETGLDKGKIFDNLVTIADKEKKTLPQTHAERFDEFEQQFNKHLVNTPEEVLEQIHAKLAVLKKSINQATQVNEKVVDDVNASEALLAELLEIEAKEDSAHAEMDDASQREYDRAFAKLSYTIAEAIWTHPLPPPHELKQRVEQPIDPGKEASRISSIVFLPGESAKSKEAKLAALLKTYAVEGTPQEQLETAAIRERIIAEAGASKLNLNRIFDLAAQPQKITKQEHGPDGEELPDLNEFEALVVEDIMGASSGKISKIQTAWKKILEDPDIDAETKRQAEEAVAVLQNIWNLKKMKEERESGQPVTKRPLEKPVFSKEDGDTAAAQTPASEEEQKVIETHKQIQMLQESIETIDSPELQGYLHELVGRMKRGMSPDDVEAEIKALKLQVRAFIGQGQHARADNTHAAAILKGLGPFNRFFETAREGVVPTVRVKSDGTEEQIVNPKGEKASEIELLKERIELFEDERMRVHLHKLMDNVSHGMNVREMEAALLQLDIAANAIANQMTIDVIDGDTTFAMKNAVMFVLAFEKNVDNYRNFLIKNITAEKEHETIKTVEQLPSEETRSLIADSENVNNLTTFQQIRVEAFEDYLVSLHNAMSVNERLTKKQLASLYSALLVQDAVLADTLYRSGEYTKLLELSEQVRTVRLEVYAKLAEVHKDKLPEVETEITHEVREKVRKYATQKGDVFENQNSDELYGQVANLGPTVVEAPTGNRMAEPGTRFDIGEAIEEIRNAPDDPNPGLPGQLQDEYKRVAATAKRQEVFTSQEMIQNMTARLSQMVSEAYRAGVDPRSVKEIEDLAQALYKQRNELTVMEHLYKGRHDEREYPREDEALYEGYVHTALGTRIKRIQDEIDARRSPGAASGDQPRRYTEQELADYFTELKKWTKILLKNDIRNNPSKAGAKDALKLSNERYNRYQAIANLEIKGAHDLKTNPGKLNEMYDAVNYMKNEGDFLRYFMRNTKNPKGIEYEKHDSEEFNPQQLLGVEYRHAEGTSSFGLPKSLEDSMSIIAKQYSTESSNYRTGGNRELIDGEGNFKYNNFYYWIREQINADVNYNKDGQINPMQKINLKGDASSVSLAELLILVPEYLSQRNFEIKALDDGQVYAGWGRQTEHPEFTWLQANQLGAEVEFRQLIHEVRIQFIRANTSGNKAEFLKLMHALHSSNHWSRGGEDGPNILIYLGLPSSVTDDTQEIDDCFINGKEKQGSIGKSMSDMLMGYYYLSELSDFYKTEVTDSHGHPKMKKNEKTGKMEPEMRDKTFNENMFYKMWEPNGANTFLINMAEGALSESTEAKREYGKFIIERIDATYAGFRRGLNAEQLEKLDQIRAQQIDSINSKIRPENSRVGLNINFTESSTLYDFIRLVEKDILGKTYENSTEEERDISRRVRDDLVDNLKSGYFAKLYGIKSYETNGADSTGLYVKAGKAIDFGDIVVKKGKNGNDYTMKDMLEDFDPKQIKLFDYTNKDDDMDNPFRNIKDKDKLRKAIDDWMDPEKNPKNHALFRKNEQMMLAFTEHIARVERKWINHFRDIPENETSRILVQNAFKACVKKAYGIDEMEAMYAWTSARDYVYIWHIGAALDVTGIGFRVDGKLLQTGKWRSHRGGKDGFGNEETIEEFHALSLPFLHALRILDIDGNNPLGHQSVWSLMQGGHGGYITPRAIREFKPRSKYRMAHDAEELYVSNNLTNAAEFVDLLATTEIDFSQIVSTDPMGNVIFHYDKAYSLFKKWRKSIRYSYQKNGLDYREVIWSNGKEKTLYKHFFGKRTRALNELKKRDLEKRGVYKKDEIYKEPADAVMLSLIAAEVYEHRKAFSHAHHWTIQHVIELEAAIRFFMQELDVVEEHGEIELVKKRNTISHELFESSLKAYHTAFYKMYNVELGSTVVHGFFKGLWDGLDAYFTKGKWVY